MGLNFFIYFCLERRVNERFGCVGVRFVLDVRESQVPFIRNLFMKDAIHCMSWEV